MVIRMRAGVHTDSKVHDVVEVGCAGEAAVVTRACARDAVGMAFLAFSISWEITFFGTGCHAASATTV